MNDNSAVSHTGSKSCSVCRELLDTMSRFFEMLDSARKAPADDWLTVEDVAKELKLSKSIVYRIIRIGELEAINIVSNNGEIAHKGHYRIKRKNLEDYIQSKTVNPIPKPSKAHSHLKRFAKVKNHLGL
jgi:DNA-binding IclR family transcriptional regulator